MNSQATFSFSFKLNFTFQRDQICYKLLRQTHNNIKIIKLFTAKSFLHLSFLFFKFLPYLVDLKQTTSCYKRIVAWIVHILYLHFIEFTINQLQVAINQLQVATNELL